MATLRSDAAVSPTHQPPVVTSLPELRTTPLVAPPYTVSMTASDLDGYNDLRCLRILFNYTESGGQTSRGRGYLAWGKTDGDIAQYGIWQSRSTPMRRAVRSILADHRSSGACPH